MLIVFTDGGDTRSTLSYVDLLNAVKATDVSVYAIGFLEHQPASVRTQQRLQLAEANAANQQDTLRLVQLRLAPGSGTDFDLARAQAQLETTRSRIPVLQARIAVAQHRLAVLTGQVPEALIAALNAPTALPQLPETIAPGTPAELFTHAQHPYTQTLVQAVPQIAPGLARARRAARKTA